MTVARSAALAATAVLALLPAIAPALSAQSPNSLTPAERAAGWRLLFDGKTTAGWRGFKMDSLPSGWQVVNGALTRVAAAGDIVTGEQFRDFELSLEWNVAPGGNSGIFYRASEDGDAIYWTAPEMQVRAGARPPAGRAPLPGGGPDSGLSRAPAWVVKPAGEWNQVRLLVKGHHVEHWLNGVKVVEYELSSPDWEARVKASKFAPHPRYGRNAQGYIGLQDHGDRVAYRDIKIRVLP